MTPEYTKFLKTGDLPASMSARSKILDICRNQILQFQNITDPTNMTLFRQNPKTGVREAVNIPNPSASITPILKGAKVVELENKVAELEAQLATAPHFENSADLATKGKPLLIAAKQREREAAKPTASAPSGVVHRAQLPATVAPKATGLVTAAEFASKEISMTRSEFGKLSPADKSRFVTQSKGKVIDDPQPAKPHRKNGQLTREGFNHLSPAAKSAHCKAKLPILD